MFFKLFMLTGRAVRIELMHIKYYKHLRRLTGRAVRSEHMQGYLNAKNKHASQSKSRITKLSLDRIAYLEARMMMYLYGLKENLIVTTIGS